MTKKLTMVAIALASLPDATSPTCDQRRPTFNFALNLDRFAIPLDVSTVKERAMHQLAAIRRSRSIVAVGGCQHR